VTEDRRSATVRRVLVLLAASLAVRIAALVPVAAANVSPVFDEKAYFARAVAFANIAKSLLAGVAPRPLDVGEAYLTGAWPPLHSMLLAVPLLFASATPTAARAIVVLLSALTTPVVYLLARRFTSSRAALAAALGHAALPSMIAFSHYLWSETTYMFCLALGLLLVVDAAARAVGSSERVVGSSEPGREPPPRRGGAGARALAAGLALGAGALSRAAGLPMIALAPAWLAWRGARPLRSRPGSGCSRARKGDSCRFPPRPASISSSETTRFAATRRAAT
jgi:4-amino-4-deoxy-L-arabinose transferase-like glycosyltransferase